MRLLLIATLTISAAGCGLQGSSCETAVRESAEKTAMEDTLQDLDPAMEQCATIEEFEAAAEQFPDALA